MNVALAADREYNGAPPVAPIGRPYPYEVFMAAKNQRESKSNKPKLSIKERQANKKAKAAGKDLNIVIPKPPK